MKQKRHYKIISIENTKAIKTNHYGKFDTEYHQKYIGKIGYIISHYVSENNIFKDFVCLVLEVDTQGRPKDAEWFHKDDLIEI